MIMQLVRLWQRGQKLHMADWQALFLLTFGALFCAFSMVCLDASVIGLWMQRKSLHGVGFDFLWIALILSFVGRFLVKLDRRRGYGGVPLIAVLMGLLVTLLWGTSFYPDIGGHLLFIYRYLAPVLMFTALWTIANRFIVLRLTSYKYVGIFSAQLLGMLWAGSIVAGTDASDFEIAIWSIVWMGALFVVLKLLVWISPMPSETFVKKSGGVQDSADAKIAHVLLALAFLYMTVLALGDAQLYHSFQLSDIRPAHVLGHLWAWRGFVGLLGVFLLYRVRYVSALVYGLSILCGGLFLVGVGTVIQQPFVIWMGYIAFATFAHLYWRSFLSTIPRVLALGQGVRLKFQRHVIIEPIGLVLGGALLLTNDWFVCGWLLMVGALILCGGIFTELSWYSRLLLQMCQTLRWCGGPLILYSKTLIRYVCDGVKRDSANESIYFLRIMQAAEYPGYMLYLVKALKHSQVQVRLFALDQLDIHGWVFSCQKQIQLLFQKDEDISVRARALAILIRIQSDRVRSQVFQKYGSYLDDKKLSSGAILGFLQSGGECALLAMDGLQRLAESQRIEDNLSALEIIDRVPQTGLVRLVLPLLKHNDLRVVRHALLTAGRIGHTQTLSFVLTALDDPQLQEAALKSLQMYGKTAFPPIEKMIGNVNVPQTRRKKLVFFLWSLPSGEGKQILLRHLNVADQNLRRDILQAVLQSKIIWVRNKRKTFLPNLISQDMQRWRWLIEQRNLFSVAPTAKLAEPFASLTRSFDQSVEQTRQMILKQLLLLYPDDLVQKCVDILLLGPTPRYLTAVSLLQDLISHKVYQEILPMLNAPINGQLVIQERNLSPGEAREFLQDLFLNPKFSVDRWVQACALNGLRSFDQVSLEPIMIRAIQSPDPVVWESLIHAMKRWVPDDKARLKLLYHMLDQQPNLPFVSYLKNERCA